MPGSIFYSRSPSQGFPKIILMDRYGEFDLDYMVTTVYYRANAFFTRWTVLWDTPVIFAVLRTD